MVELDVFVFYFNFMLLFLKVKLSGQLQQSW